MTLFWINNKARKRVKNEIQFSLLVGLIYNFILLLTFQDFEYIILFV